MQILQLAPNLYQTIFTPRDADELDFSLTVLVEGRRALLIDAAFRLQAEELRAHLTDAGLQPVIVLLSHYHPDHFKGAAVFADCELWASPHYTHNYALYRSRRPDKDFPIPTRLLADGEETTFGDFALRFLHAPGHSPCSLITLINARCAQVGDLLMATPEGLPTLPRVEDYPAMIASLECLRALDVEVLLLSHGLPLLGRAAIHARIDETLYYLRSLWDSRGILPLADCLPRDVAHYGRLELHEHNLGILRIA